MGDVLQGIHAEARRLENAFDRASRGHYAAAERWERRYYLLGLPATVLAGAAGVSALADVPNGALVAGALALVGGALTAALTFLDPRDRANKHRQAAEEFNCLRHDALHFVGVVLATEATEADLLKAVEGFRTQRHELGRRSLQVPTWAYARVRREMEDKKARVTFHWPGRRKPLTFAWPER